MTTIQHPGPECPDTDFCPEELNLIEGIFNQVVKIYLSSTVDISGLPVLLVKIMELVEKIKNLSGPDKKRIVLDVLRLFIKKSGLVKDKIKFESVALVIADPIIDTIISASKMQLGLNRPKKCCF